MDQHRAGESSKEDPAAPPASMASAAEVQQSVCAEILALANRLTLEAAELLRPAGLTHAQYNVLRILRQAGEGGLPCSEISRRMITRDPDVTRLLDRLERGKWIVRERPPADRRKVHARISEEGLRLLAGLDAPVRALHARQFEPLGGHGLLWLRKLLKVLQEEKRDG